MKDGAAILKVCQFKTFALLNNAMGSGYVSMSPKTSPFRPSLELFSFFKQLTELIEEHLDLGPTTDRQVLKSTYLHMSLPKIPTLEEYKRKKVALMPSNCVETFSC